MENNRLIAEFMGLELTTDGISDLYYTKDKRLKQIEKYHTSWDWLMPVVERIESLGYDVIIRKDSIEIMCENVRHIQCFNTNKHITIYQAVVEFIKEYNYEKLFNPTPHE